MFEIHSQRAHAKLAPSAAHRWMNCPGSVKLSEPFLNTSSVFAAEGTAAHELASYCLANRETPDAFLGYHINVQTSEILDATPPEDAAENVWFEVTEDMADAVSVYVEYSTQLSNDTYAPGAEFEIEQRLDMTHLHPSIFGTGDGLVFGRKLGHLDVLDYKHGKGVVVSAEENEQLMLYAAGAAIRYYNRGVRTLTLHIVQPRASGPAIKTFELDVLELFEFQDRVKSAAALTDTNNAPFKAGDWCRFCPALAVCAEARKASLANIAEEFGDVGDVLLTDIDKLSSERMSEILKEADRLGSYVKAVQQYAHDEALKGNMPLGYKLVEKRATRRWKNDGDVEAYLAKQHGSLPDEAFTEPKLKSPSQLEKLFPGKNKDQRQEAMKDLVTKQSSGVNLAPESDPRPAVQVGASADFESGVSLE